MTHDENRAETQGSAELARAEARGYDRGKAAGFHEGRADVRESETDCGLPNHETFAVSMILAGNVGDGSGREQRERVRATVARTLGHALQEESPDGSDAVGLVREAVATALEAWTERQSGVLNACAQELVTACVLRVDWRQLADHELVLLAEDGSRDAATWLEARGADR